MHKHKSLFLSLAALALIWTACQGWPQRVGIKKEEKPSAPASAVAPSPAGATEQAPDTTSAAEKTMAPTAAAGAPPVANAAVAATSTPPVASAAAADAPPAPPSAAAPSAPGGEAVLNNRLDDHGRRLDQLELQLAMLEARLRKASGESATLAKAKKAARPAKVKKEKDNDAGLVLQQSRKPVAPPQTQLSILGTAGTEVKVNGKALGPVPQTILNPLPGDYQIELTQPGFAPYSQLVRVEKGENVTVNLSQRSQKQETKVAP